MNTLVPISNVEAYQASTDAAHLCKEIVVASAMEIQGRKYVKVEGWQAIAIAHGCTGSARDVERVDGGIRAVGEVRRMSDGQIIAEAEGFVGEDEPTWFGGEVTSKYGTKTLPKRADYAIRAMAQTRAISRACRSAFAHVVVMMNAGLSTTPAEEVPLGGFDDSGMRDVTPKADPKPQANKEAAPPEGDTAARVIQEMRMLATGEALSDWANKNINRINALGRKGIDDVQLAYSKYQDELDAKAKPAATASSPLKDRAFLLETAIKNCPDVDSLRKVYDASKLTRDELDKHDPEALVEINSLYEGLFATLPALEHA